MSNTDITKIQTTDTFQVWLTRTNDIIDLANENVMLAGPLGFTVEGNSTLTGTFTANTLVADSEFRLPVGTTAERPTPLIGSLRFNSESDSFEGYDGVDWGDIGGSAGLGNPIFITSNYTAEVNDYIVADSSAASFSIILPLFPEEGDIIRISTVSAQINNVIIAGNGNTFEGNATDLLVNVDFIIIDFIYNSSTWRVFTNFGLGPDVQTKIETDTTTNLSKPIAFAEISSGETDTLFVSVDDLSFNPSTKRLSTTNFTVSGNTSIGTLSVSGNTSLANTAIDGGVAVTGGVAVIGEVTADSFNSLSDASFKQDVIKIASALDIVNRLSGVEFEWKKNSEKSAGVIAQELEKVLPHAVSETNGIKSVNYNVIIAYLIEAIKELKNQK